MNEQLSQKDRDLILSIDAALGDGLFLKAYQIAKPYADTGYAWAEACLGSLYLCGLGVEQDLWRAKQYLELAAEQGHGGAWYSLGNLYLMGADDFQADPEQGKRCFEKATELGYFPGKPLPGLY